jgi:hypothetical protein
MPPSQDEGPDSGVESEDADEVPRGPSPSLSEQLAKLMVEGESDSDGIVDVEGAIVSEGSPDDTDPDVVQFVGTKAPTLADTPQAVLESSGPAWAKPLQEKVKEAVAALGEPRCLRMWSACSGLFTEGKVMEARSLASVKAESFRRLSGILCSEEFDSSSQLSQPVARSNLALVCSPEMKESNSTPPEHSPTFEVSR